MAPKPAHGAPPPVPEVKQPDTSPWGAFVNVLVPTASLVLAVPLPLEPVEDKPKTPVTKGKGKDAAPPPPVHKEPLPAVIPKTHFTLAYSDAFAPPSSTPTAPEEPPPADAVAQQQQQPQSLTYRHFGAEDAAGAEQPAPAPLCFCHNAGLPALEQLLNTTVLLRLHDSATGNVLASVALDMLPFGLGKQSFELEGLVLAPQAEGGPSEGALKLVSGTLPKVLVSLTAREQPPASEEGEAAAAGEQPLPEPQPYRFISEAEVAEGGNVIELTVGPVDGVPPGLQAAIDAVLGKDGQQGKVSFTLGLALPAPGPTLLLPGRLAPGGGPLTFGPAGTAPVPSRFLLSADAAEALRSHLEAGNGLSLEVARYVQQNNEVFSDSAWAAWHAVSPLPGSEALLEEGVRRLPPPPPEGLPLEPWAADTASCLPPPPETPAGAKPGKPLEPELVAAGPAACAWQSANSRLSSFSFTLVNPLVPIWTPPPAPGRKIPDLVPTRDLHPAPPPVTAADAFKAQVRAAVQTLAQAYRERQPEEEGADAAQLPPAQRHKRLIFELNRSGAYLELMSSLKAPLLRLVKEEQGASGAMDAVEMGPLYSQLYARTLDLMHMGLSSATDASPKPLPATPPPPAEAARLLRLAKEYEDFALWLLRCGCREGQAVGAGAALAERARGALERAEALHQRLLLDRDTAQTWQSHAEFCLRRGDRATALGSTRAALEVDPAFPPALLLLAAMQLDAFLAAQQQQGGEPEAAEAARQLLDEALVAGHALLATAEPDTSAQGLPWALLALCYASDPSLPGACRRNLPWASCRQALSKLERQALALGQPASEANGFFQLWSALASPSGGGGGDGNEPPSGSLGLPLPRVAHAARAALPALQRSAAALGAEADGLLALTLLAPAAGAADGQQRGAELAQAGALARAAARRAAAAGSPAAAATPLLLQAEAAWQLGRLGEVAVYCQRACAALGNISVPLAVQLRLAQAYCLLGQPQCAVHSLAAALATDGPDAAAAAAASSCADSPLAWLLAGAASLASGDAAAADAALCESNALDPELPEPWGLLALLSVRGARWNDARAALARGRAVGLRDPEVLGVVAEGFEAAGRWEEAAGVLQWVVQAAGGEGGEKLLEAQRRLARAHAALGNARDARRVVGDAAAAAARAAEAEATQAAQAAQASVAAQPVEGVDGEDGEAPPQEADPGMVAAAAAAAAAAGAAAGDAVQAGLLDELHMWRDALPVDEPLDAQGLAAAAAAAAEAAAAQAAQGDAAGWEGEAAGAGGEFANTNGFAAAPVMVA